MKSLIIKSAAILFLIFIFKFMVADVSAVRHIAKSFRVCSRVCTPSACVPGTWGCRCRNVCKISRYY